MLFDIALLEGCISPVSTTSRRTARNTFSVITQQPGSRSRRTWCQKNRLEEAYDTTCSDSGGRQSLAFSLAI